MVFIVKLKSFLIWNFCYGLYTEIVEFFNLEILLYDLYSEIVEFLTWKFCYGLYSEIVEFFNLEILFRFL